MKRQTIIGTISGILAGSTVSYLFTTYMNKISIKEKNNKINKFRGYYEILNRWLLIKQDGKTLEQYFLDNGYKNIAIYGMGELGNRLYDELKNSTVKVVYAMDTNYSVGYSDLDIKHLEDELPETDVIVITAIFAVDEITKKLERVVNCDIISLENAVYNI